MPLPAPPPRLMLPDVRIGEPRRTNPGVGDVPNSPPRASREPTSPPSSPTVCRPSTLESPEAPPRSRINSSLGAAPSPPRTSDQPTCAPARLTCISSTRPSDGGEYVHPRAPRDSCNGSAGASSHSGGNYEYSSFALAMMSKSAIPEQPCDHDNGQHSPNVISSVPSSSAGDADSAYEEPTTRVHNQTLQTHRAGVKSAYSSSFAPANNGGESITSKPFTTIQSPRVMRRSSQV